MTPARFALLLSLSSIACGGAAAPGAPTKLSSTAVYANGAVLEGGQKVLTIEEASPDPSTSTYAFKSADGQVQAALALFRRAEGTSARADFPSINRTYQKVYKSGTTMLDVLEAWEKEHVLVGAKVNLAGLKGYCESNDIILVDTNAKPPAAAPAK